MCYEFFKLHGIKKQQSARKEIQNFLKQTFDVSIKTFCYVFAISFKENLKEKFFRNDSSFISNFINGKTNTIPTIQI